MMYSGDEYYGDEITSPLERPIPFTPQASEAFRSELIDSVSWMLTEKQTHGSLLNEAGTSHTAIGIVYHPSHYVVTIAGRSEHSPSVDVIVDRLLKAMGYRLRRY